MSRGNVLFVDDERELREATGEWLSLTGFSVHTANNADDALSRLQNNLYDVLVTDIRMPGMDGMELLNAARVLDPFLPVVLLTGHGDVTLAVEAMREGAHDFLEKPYDADHLVAVIDRAVKDRRLQGEVEKLRAISSGSAIESLLIGAASSITRLRTQILQLADIDIDVLIQGETGTGKEVVARALHDCGKRAGRPFVPLNCAAIPESVFESELFGHERGAFTGADARRIGRIAHAEGGTVFLDEIESMPLGLQAKLLRVIQERVVEPLGSNKEIPINVRFIAATKSDLRVDGDAGRFRTDLYFRLSTVVLELPPLRERRDDIPLLFRYFVSALSRRHSVVAPPTSAEYLAALRLADWPGNVRELKAAAERFVLGLPAGRYGAFRSTTINGENGTLPERIAAYEAALIIETLAACDGNSRLASEVLGVPRRTLNEKITRYSLRSSDIGETDKVS